MRNELIPFLGVDSNGDAGGGKFDAQLTFDEVVMVASKPNIFSYFVGIGGRGKQDRVGSPDVEAQGGEFLDQGSEGMKGFLITSLVEAAVEVGEGGAVVDVTQAGKSAIGLAQPRIGQEIM